MFRASTLLLALLISSPVLWQALTDPATSTTAAVVRFLIAIPVAGVLLGLVRTAATRRDQS